MVNLEMLEKLYFCNSLNVPYKLKKGGEIEIKPIKVKDYPIYEIASEILTYNKNESTNIEILQMSYLEFLVKYIFTMENGDEKIQDLIWLAKNCLGYDYISIEVDKNKPVITLCKEDGTVEKIINRKEFDDIKKIILNQNNPKYDNRYISPDVREMLNEYIKVQYKDGYIPTLEQRKAFVSSKTGRTFAELNELPYREFDLVYDANVNSEIYIAQKIIQGSYKYEVKEDIKHPLFSKPHDIYSELFKDTSVLSGKGISGAEQLNMINNN